MCEAREKVDRLRSLRRQYVNTSEIEGLRSWLLSHPAEAVAAITGLNLSKGDSGMAELIGAIGPPTAIPCVPQLIGLIGDVNWPVYSSAVKALSRFEWSLLKQAVRQLVNQRAIEEVAHFCDWALYDRPGHVRELQPLLKEVIAQPGHDEIDLERAQEVWAEIDEKLAR